MGRGDILKKDIDIVVKKNVEFDDNNSAQFIYSDLYQPLSWPEEYPCFIQIHSEWPVQDVPLHWHHGPELIYSRNQDIELIIDTKKTIIHPGECVLISSGAIHNVIPKKQIRNQDVMSFTFKGTYIEKLYPKLRQTKISYMSPSSTDENRKDLVECCEKLYTIIKQDSKDYFAVNEVLFHILGLIFNCFVSKESNETQSAKYNHDKMSLVLQYVEEHYQEELTVSSIAMKFGYSREYFSRLFKRYADVSFKQYVNEFRLMKASNELYTTDKRIADIAYDNGFADEKSFYALFKKKHKMTPLEYRKSKYE